MFAKQARFVGAKIPCPYGPSEGDEGLKKNVNVFKQARQSVGPDFPLMCVCVCVCVYVYVCVYVCVRVYVHIRVHVCVYGKIIS